MISIQLEGIVTHVFPLTAIGEFFTESLRFTLMCENPNTTLFVECDVIGGKAVELSQQLFKGLRVRISGSKVSAKAFLNSAGVECSIVKILPNKVKVVDTLTEEVSR